MDDCEKYVSSAGDYLVDTLIKVMQRFYNMEQDRQAEILKVSDAAGIYMKTNKIGDGSIDGDLSGGFLRYQIAGGSDSKMPSLFTTLSRQGIKLLNTRIPFYLA